MHHLHQHYPFNEKLSFPALLRIALFCCHSYQAYAELYLGKGVLVLLLVIIIIVPGDHVNCHVLRLFSDLVASLYHACGNFSTRVIL